MKAKLVLSLLLLSNIFFTGVDKLQAQKLSGQEFWFTLPRMAPLQGNVEGLFLYIVSDYCVDDAYVEAPGLGYRQTFTVDRGSYTRLQIPLTVTGTPIYHNSPRQVENKGLFLKSEYPVVVYAVTYESASVDGEVIIPLNQLGKKYIVSNRGGIVSGQMRNTIVATEDNTDVEINTWDNANNPIIYNVTLNKGQTWQWSRTRANIAGDYPRGMNGTPSSFTGSVVNADKPIAIIGSIDCAGGNECGACENTFITHQPEKDWGTKHVTAQVIPRSNPALGASCNPFGNVISGDFIEVLGEVGTNVTINDHRGNRTATIAAPPYDAGAGYGYGYLFFEIPVNGTDYGFANTVITSDKPVQVTQHPKGWQTDSQGSSDPEAIAVFPTKTWTTSYIFAILSTATTLNNDFTLIVDNSVANAGDPQPINNFEYDDGNLVRNVNNVPGATAWVRIGTSNYFYKRIPSILNTNTLRIYSRTLTPFGIYTSSRGQAESYIQG
ncbi:MAG: IgGFc-binding protein, partial [Luteibaculum sp.]